MNFMNGKLGVPAGGFPEDFRQKVLKGQSPTVPDGTRPGVNMISVNFEEEGKIISDRIGVPLTKTLDTEKEVSDYLHHNDVISHALYPEVHRDFRQFIGKYSDTSILPTPYFFSKMKVGEEFSITHMGTRDVSIKLVAIGSTSDEGFKRVFFEVNNQANSFDVIDRTSDSSFQLKRDKADLKEKG